MQDLYIQADIARRMGVKRQHLSWLRRQPGFPSPYPDNRFDLAEIRAWLRRRLASKRPLADICATCGGDVSS